MRRQGLQKLVLLTAILAVPAGALGATPGEVAREILSDERFQKEHPEGGDRSGSLGIFPGGGEGDGEGDGMPFPMGGGGAKRPGKGSQGSGTSGKVAGGGTGQDQEDGDGSNRPSDGEATAGSRGGQGSGDSRSKRGGAGDLGSLGGDDGSASPDPDGKVGIEGDGDGAVVGGGTRGEPPQRSPSAAAERERKRRERMRAEREKRVRIPLRQAQAETSEPIVVEAPSAMGSLFNTLLIGLLIAIVALLIAWGVGQYLRSKEAPLAADEAEKKPKTSLGDDEPVEPSDVDRLASEGRYGEAVHAMFLLAVAHLAETKCLVIADDMTAREAQRALNAPEAIRAAFGDLLAAVEVSLFGGEELDQAAYVTARSAYDAIVKHDPRIELPRAA